MPDLVLYSMESCPFCQVVLTYLNDNNITLEIRDIIQQSEYRAELIEKGGKSQVPCLLINDTPLYESMDIIKWFKDTYPALSS